MIEREKIQPNNEYRKCGDHQGQEGRAGQLGVALGMEGSVPASLVSGFPFKGLRPLRSFPHRFAAVPGGPS
jgi:hypothetical protein